MPVLWGKENAVLARKDEFTRLSKFNVDVLLALPVAKAASTGWSEMSQHRRDRLCTFFIRSFPTGCHQTCDNPIVCDDKQNVKQIPYFRYLCNVTQLYIGACVIYIIILTNEAQSLLPG